MKHDAALDEEVPQIRTGKRVGEHLHVAYLLPPPADTLFGNLAGKYIDIVVRLDHVNVLVARVFSSYESAKCPERRTHLLGSTTRFRFCVGIEWRPHGDSNPGIAVKGRCS